MILGIVFFSFFSFCTETNSNIVPKANKFQILEPPPGFRLTTDCTTGLLKKENYCIYDLKYISQPASNGGLGQSVPQAKINPRVIDLGRYLFFDPILSGDSKLSCAHCHHPGYGLSDGRQTSIGRAGTGYGPDRKSGVKLRRSSPSLWNVAFNRNLFWDGRAANLEDQTEGPLFSQNEMASSPELIESRLNNNQIYKRLFLEAFGPRAKTITTKHVIEAISSFERSLVSFSSRFDMWSAGQKDALSVQELNGYNVYRSFVARCSECHTPPLFTNGVSAVIGAPETSGRDLGREELTGQPLLRGSFRVPSLRNIARTAPYMHSGGLATLEDVVDFYDAGGGRGNGSPDDLRIHWHVRKMGLSSSERRDLVTFLNSLTDEKSMPIMPMRVPSGLPVAFDLKSYNNRSKEQ